MKLRHDPGEEAAGLAALGPLIAGGDPHIRLAGANADGGVMPAQEPEPFVGALNLEQGGWQGCKACALQGRGRILGADLGGDGDDPGT